jgi:hypothetical protein
MPKKEKVLFSIVMMKGPFCKRSDRPGLPDGMFSNQKSKFGQILDGIGMEKVGKLVGHLEYNTDIWYILCPFGNLVAIWYIFHHFGILC